MATAEGLMGVGVPAEVARRNGWEIVALTSTGTTQGAAGGVMSGPGNKLVLATPHASDGAFTLPSNADKGDEILVVNEHASNSLDLFPATGHSIHKLSANGGTPVATAQSFHAIKVSATRWIGRLVATPAAT